MVICYNLFYVKQYISLKYILSYTHCNNDTMIQTLLTIFNSF